MLDKLATPEYWEGEEAARSGKSREDNPHLPGTMKRFDWQTGFDNEVQSQQDNS